LDLRISELPDLLPVDAEGGDDLAVADYSSSETRKLSLKNLVQEGVTRIIDDGVLPGAKLVTDSVTSQHIGPNAVTASELADNAVDTAAVQAAAITNIKLAAGIDGGKLKADSVTAREIATNAITASELADGAVDTAAVQAAAITNAKLATGIDGAKLVDGSVANAKLAAGIDGGKLVADSVTAREIAANAITASELADGAVDTAAIQPNAVTTDRVLDAAITNAKLATGIDGAKLVSDSVTAAQIAPNAITASELADNAVDTAAVADAAITDAKLATGIDGAKLTAGSVADAALATGIDGAKLKADSVTAAAIAPDAITASELADDAVDTAAVKDAAITDAKLATGIDGAKLKADSVGTAAIATDAITAVELAGDAVDTAAIQDGAITDAKITSVNGAKLAAGTVPDSALASGIDGAKLKAGSVTDAALASGINGSKLSPASVSNAALASGIDGAKLTADTVSASALSPASFNRGIDRTGSAIGHTNAVAAGTSAGITYDAQGHVTGAVPLAATDLPIATAATVGAVSIGSGSGLVVGTGGAVVHSNSVTPGKVSGITVDAQGHVTKQEALVATDLPKATTSAIGAVSVPVAGELTVDAGGAVAHKTSGIAAGTYTKVTVNATGHVTASQALEATDLPGIPAEKITSGTLDVARLAHQSIGPDLLKNYTVSYIQEATPPVSDPTNHVGRLWYQESTGQLHMFNGNSFMPVGFGRLSDENLRFCGTFNATAGQAIDLTDFGVAAGLTPAAALPAASTKLTGAYLVVTIPGTHDAIAYDNGDWILCMGTQWIRVDTLNGTGSATIKVSDLLDTTITTPASGDTLIFDASVNKWVNKPTAAQKATFVETLNGTRTSYTLSTDANSVNNLMISLGGILQEPGVDFTFTAPRTVNFPTAPPAGMDYWILIEGVASTGGGGGGTTLTPGTADEEYLGWVAATSSWQPKNTIDAGVY